MAEHNPQAYFTIINSPNNGSVAIPLSRTIMYAHIGKLPKGANFPETDGRVLVAVAEDIDSYGDPTLRIDDVTPGHTPASALVNDRFLIFNQRGYSIPGTIEWAHKHFSVEIAHSEEVSRRGLRRLDGIRPAVLLLDNGMRRMSLEENTINTFLLRDTAEQLFPGQQLHFEWLENKRGCDADVTWTEEGLKVDAWDVNVATVTIPSEAFEYEELVNGVGKGIRLPVLYREEQGLFDEVYDSEVFEGVIKQPVRRKKL